MNTENKDMHEFLFISSMFGTSIIILAFAQQFRPILVLMILFMISLFGFYLIYLKDKLENFDFTEFLANKAVEIMKKIQTKNSARPEISSNSENITGKKIESTNNTGSD